MMHETARPHVIYILLIRSETWLSRLIHVTTAADYTHVSISLDGPTGPFYSFGRKNPEHSLPAGLVQEPMRWNMKHRYSAPCCLYSLNVSDESYMKLRRRVNQMYAQRDLYNYNILGLLGAFFNFPLKRRYHYFCSQFVANILAESGALEFDKSPDLLRPTDFCALEQLIPVHQGSLGSLPGSISICS